MKANAPEKIYLFENPITETPDDRWLSKRSDDNDIEYARTDAFIKKAKEAFCKATCNGKPPRSTCTSLGTCKEHDNFVKFLKGE